MISLLHIQVDAEAPAIIDRRTPPRIHIYSRLGRCQLSLIPIVGGFIQLHDVSTFISYLVGESI